MTNRDRFLAAAVHGKNSRGKDDFISYLKDNKILTLKESVHAFCFGCQGYYIDGVKSCADEDCLLFPYNPYNPNKRKRTRNLTEEQRKAASERLSKIRQQRSDSLRSKNISNGV